MRKATKKPFGNIGVFYLPLSPCKIIVAHAEYVKCANAVRLLLNY